jgi:cytochrome c-type biogenesis protein CcmH
MSTYFWFAAGTLTGLAAAVVVIPIARALVRESRTRAFKLGSVAILLMAFAVTAFTLYRTLGRPEAIDASRAATLPAHPGARTPSAGEQVDSLDSATRRLEERLGREGGSAEDWQLLAQSYEALGRPQDAERARQQAVGAPPVAPQPARNADTVRTLEERVRAAPRDANAWLELASLYRQQREFDKARGAFDKLIALRAMTADSWADYADVLATSTGGSLAGEPARAIDRALALDPRHTKALWLKASLAHEQHRYKDSLAVWKQLRATLPADSPDVPIIDSNIAEATTLAGLPPPAAQASPRTVQVHGTVSIDKALAARVAPGAVLFIYAKAADSPGPPLAVLRTAATSWPVNFQLDDTLAMVPTRKLSDFTRVVIGARVSSSGQAMPAPGDLYAESPVLQPADGQQVQLVISQVIG